MKVLFVCVGNTCRSQMAEAICKSLGHSADSAGTHPGSEVNPNAIIALEEKGVALVPGSSFGDNASEFVRISFANSLENIKEAINRLSTI